LPGGWLRLSLEQGEWDGWTIDVLADYVDGRIRCVGLKVEPPEGDFLKQVQLRKLNLNLFARLAEGAWTANAEALRETVRELTQGGARPYRGSATHRQAVSEVVRAAKDNGESPARVVMRVFNVKRATAYRYIAEATEGSGDGGAT